MILLMTAFWSCLLLQIWIHQSYGAHMPASPQPALGRVYSVTVDHGAIRYVTKEEFDRADFILGKLQVLQLILFAGMGTLRLLSKKL